MGREELDNLVRIGKLKEEPTDAAEVAGLIRSGRARLADAKNMSLSQISRFDLAYNAAHALALAALRWHGYRSDNRYLVFQCLKHTLSLDNEQWRVLDLAHRRRNLSEYEGVVEVDDHLLESMLRTASVVEERISRLDSPSS